MGEATMGIGYSYGYGSGYSYGDGYGDGYSYSYGSGFGSGFGYGSGYSYGDGYGDQKTADIAIAYLQAYASPEALKLQAAGATLAFWKSKNDLSPGCNSGAPRQIGAMEIVKGPLLLCSAHALHASLCPWKWGGSRLWIVALHGEVMHDKDKMGALQRTIVHEIDKIW
jgi:hypothetical protein